MPHGGPLSGNRGETPGAGQVGLSATAAVVVDVDGGRPRIRWTQAWPIVLRPTGNARVHLVHGAGGPLGGDVLALDVRVGASATLAVRSAGATIVQPGRGSDPARWDFDVVVDAGAQPGLGAGTDRGHRRGGLPDVAAGRPRRRGAGGRPGGRRARPPRQHGWPLPRAARRDRRRPPATGPHDVARRRRPRAVRAGWDRGRARRRGDPRRRGRVAGRSPPAPTCRSASGRTCGGRGRTWPGRVGPCSPSASRAPWSRSWPPPRADRPA